LISEKFYNSETSQCFQSIDEKEIKKYHDVLEKFYVSNRSYEVLEYIDRGISGRVERGLYKNSIQAAIKIIEFNENTKIDDRLTIIKELYLLANFHQLNIPLFHGYSIDEKNIYFIMELCEGGSLEKTLYNTNIPLTIKQRLKFIKDSADAVSYIHSKNIIHRDIKSLNILLSRRIKDEKSLPDAKLCDFGVSKDLNLQASVISGVGTILWMAPEILSAIPYDYKADIYSFGVFMWEIFSRKIPYSYMKNIALESISAKVSIGKLKLDLSYCCPDTPNEIKTIIEKCLNYEPNLRPSMSEIRRCVDDLYSKS
jgi:serine/threonine protein kinase